MTNTSNRLPHFAEMVKWLEGNGAKTVLWIAPFFQGEMAKEAHAKSRAIAERKPDLKALDEELRLWFAKRSAAPNR